MHFKYYPVLGKNTYINWYFALMLLLLTPWLHAQVATFSKVYNILQTNCTGCHSPAVGALPLLTGTEEEVYSLLVNATPVNPVAQQRGDKLVRPGYPERSFLVRKTNHGLYPSANIAAGEGGNMPAEPLSPTQRELIRQWVMYGAPMTGSVDNENAIADFYAGDSIPRIAPLAPPAPGEGFQVYLGTLFIEPDQEYEFIKKHEIPLGDSLEIIGIECRMNPYSHHYGVSKFRSPKFAADAPEGIRPMNDILGAIDFFNNSSYVAGAQSPQNQTILPENTAFRWEIGTTLNLNYHIYNYSPAGVLAAEAYINFYTQPRGTADYEMQTATITQTNPFELYLPPDSLDHTFTIEYHDSTSTEQMNIWLLTSHTHSRGRDFDIYKRNTDGTRGEQIYEGFYDSEYTTNMGFYDYSHPPVRHFDPMLPIQLDEGLMIDATYNNQTAAPITFGMSVNDEMFISYILYTLGEMEGVGTTNPIAPNTLLSLQPNPCHNNLRLSFALNQAEKVNIDLFDTAGRHLNTLLSADMPSGKHQANATLPDNLPAGLYIVQLRTDQQTQTQRIVKW